MSERIHQLQEFYDEDPHDPFNLYALAIEYQKHDVKKAIELFERLLHDFQDYVPSYYHAAKLFESAGMREKAVSTYEKGIEVAKKGNDLKTARELKSAYDELLFE